jgi:hypothetical protein
MTGKPQLFTIVAHGRPVAVDMIYPPEWGETDAKSQADVEACVTQPHRGDMGDWLRKLEDRRSPGRALWDGNPNTVTVRPASQRETIRWQREFDDAVAKGEYYGEGYVVWLVPLRDPSDEKAA